MFGNTVSLTLFSSILEKKEQLFMECMKKILFRKLNAFYVLFFLDYKESMLLNRNSM